MTKFELLENITKLEDMFIHTKPKLSYAKYDWFIAFFRDNRRK